MSRAIDLIITYRVVKMLVTPFNKFKAYDLGIIDEKGKVLRKFKEVKGIHAMVGRVGHSHLWPNIRTQVSGERCFYQGLE